MTPNVHNWAWENAAKTKGHCTKCGIRTEPKQRKPRTRNQHSWKGTDLVTVQAYQREPGGYWGEKVPPCTRGTP